MNIWKEKALFERKLYIYSKEILADNDNITFESFADEFVMYLGSMCLCIVCFFLEIIYYIWSNRKSRRYNVQNG
jgi:hypothetical protein